MKDPSIDQLMASDADLTAWAKAHGPDYLRFAAERGYTIKAGVMDTIAQSLADVLDGRVVRAGDRLIQWRPRREPSEASVARGAALLVAFSEWLTVAPLPALVRFEPTGVVRVEEQPDPSQLDDTLKYTGFVVAVKHPATAERFIVVNLEA